MSSADKKVKGQRRKEKVGAGRSYFSRTLLAFCLLPCALLFSGCRQDMQDQPRYESYEKSTFYADGRASRQPVEGTVARGQMRDDARLYTGRTDAAQQAALVDTIPLPLTSEMVDRGQERYNIYCSACHGMTGVGDGLVVRRGFRPPPSFHIDRLREAPVGHFFDVMTNGFGAMPDYASQVSVSDRWAIVAYIRALQLSQRAEVADVPAAERNKLATGGEK
jgi:mono/diheme cytochrome c family protein